ncbi:MAG: hypothetical protein RID23_13990 [Roseovarius sp.]
MRSFSSDRFRSNSVSTNFPSGPNGLPNNKHHSSHNSTDKTTPQNTPTPRKADQNQRAKPQRRKKAPPIDVDALNESDQKLLQNIATTGVRVAGRQKKIRDGQLNAMKDTLADILADGDEAETSFLEHFFKVMLDNATYANARMIASHPHCPSDLAELYRRRA